MLKLTTTTTAMATAVAATRQFSDNDAENLLRIARRNSSSNLAIDCMCLSSAYMYTFQIVDSFSVMYQFRED